jgi:hypothetical protein
MPTKLAALANLLVGGHARAGRMGWRVACSRGAVMRKIYLALLLTGCTAPSVPLPPPELPALTFTGTTPGVVQIVGKPSSRHADARFYVFDYGTGDGVITQAAHDGSFTSMPFTGNDGDGVQIYFDDTNGERSQDVCTTLQRNVGLISTVCPSGP